MKHTTTHAHRKNASVPSRRPAFSMELPALIDRLERIWRGPRSDEVARLFAALRAHVAPAPAVPTPPSTAAGAAVAGSPAQIDALDLLRRTFSAHDLLFLRRQITYHIAAAAGLPQAYAVPDRVQTATANLVEYMATRAPRGSRLSVQIQEIPMRTGTGLEIQFAGTDNELMHVDKTTFVHRMYEAENEQGAALVNCRELVASQGGQMWADLPRPKQPVFHMVLPTSPSEITARTGLQQMFKYDISIANYPTIRKRFGIKKSLFLVGQIEMYVRALVRHPIDIVTAVRERGLITTIYETLPGAAQSVASRISQRLGTEEFRIGKKQVDILFKYQLSRLPSGASSTSSQKETTHP